jgi:hypothetical protein
MVNRRGKPCASFWSPTAPAIRHWQFGEPTCAGIRARKDGELFFYVNDAILGVRGYWDCF